MPDKKDFISIFKAETEDHLTALEKGLVKLEKKPDNIPLIIELNREAHTLKGSSRIFGYHEIQEIAHRIEDVFDRLRQKRLIFNSSIADRIFKGLDIIRTILGEIAKEEKIDIDISDACKDLEECLHSRKHQKKNSNTRAKTQKSRMKVQLGAKLDSNENSSSMAETPDSDMGEAERVQPAGQMEEYIRVPLSRVNRLLNLGGEMVINKMKSSAKIAKIRRLAKLAKEAQKTLTFLTEKIKRDFPDPNVEVMKFLSQCNAQIQNLKETSLILYDDLSRESFHLDPIIDELQNKMKEIRMLPCSTIFDGFVRMVRDIASRQGKEVNLEICGEETELDKNVLDGIKPSLLHILRNCVDHGIEDPDQRGDLGKPKWGTIRLSAYHEAGNVVILIEDDGRGMDIEDIKRSAQKKDLVSMKQLEQMTDEEVLNLIFMNGYTTSPIITDISGRGIGLDIVRRDIENLKGQISLNTQKGQGTRIMLILPLTIAIIQILLLKIQKILFAFPMTSVAESLRVKRNEISSVEGRMAIQVRGRTVPLVKLEEVLGLPVAQAGLEVSADENIKGRESGEKEMAVIIAGSLEKQVGFIVDEIVGEEEVFIKNLGEHLGKLKNVSGATILGTGEVVVILDVGDLIVNSSLSHPAVIGREPVPKEKRKDKKILVVEDALSTRELEKSILEAQGYAVDTAVDGLDALNRVSETRYDLFVCDIEMPRMDGFEFCKTVKKNEEYKDIPVIMVTAMDKEEDKRRGIEAGAQAYIVKTAFDQSNLLDTIERLIG